MAEAPKKKVTGFQLWAAAVRPTLVAEESDTHTVQTTLLQMWRELSPTEKATYADAATAARKDDATATATAAAAEATATGEGGAAGDGKRKAPTHPQPPHKRGRGGRGRGGRGWRGRGRGGRDGRRPAGTSLGPHAFDLFAAEVGTQAQRDDPTATFADVLRRLGTAWHALSHDGRSPYYDTARRQQQQQQQQQQQEQQQQQQPAEAAVATTVDAAVVLPPTPTHDALPDIRAIVAAGAAAERALTSLRDAFRWHSDALHALHAAMHTTGAAAAAVAVVDDASVDDDGGGGGDQDAET